MFCQQVFANTFTRVFCYHRTFDVPEKGRKGGEKGEKRETNRVVRDVTLTPIHAYPTGTFCAWYRCIAILLKFVCD